MLRFLVVCNAEEFVYTLIHHAFGVALSVTNGGVIEFFVVCHAECFEVREMYRSTDKPEKQKIENAKNE